MLRGLAALAVTWFHLTNTYDAGWLRSSSAYGWAGVDVFFVISGFIIPYSISRSSADIGLRRFPMFLARRMARLEPPYLLSILLMLGLWYASSLTPGYRGEPPQFNAGQIASHALYLIPLTDFDWLQPVYWTLAYEFVFYIVVGLLFGLIAPDKPDLFWALLSCVTLALVMTSALDEKALLFVIGISVFRARCCANAWPSIVIAVFAVAYLWVEYRPGAVAGGTTALAIGLLTWVRLPAFSARPLLWLGAISYSLYLTHVPIGGRVVNLGKRIADSEIELFAVSLAALAASLAFAAAWHAIVEWPAIRLSRSLGRPSNRDSPSS